MKTVLLSVATLSILATATYAAKAAAGAEVGATAPSFELSDTKGKTQKLSDYQGKYVVLEWTNHQCPFVKKHYGSGNMQALQAYAKSKGVVWLSIVSSAPGNQGYGTAQELDAVMKEQKAVPTAKLLDPTGAVGKAYGAKTTPQIFVIDPKGTVVYSGGIDDKPTPDPADIKTAHNYVKAAIDEISAGKPISTPSSRPYGCSVKY